MLDRETNRILSSGALVAAFLLPPFLTFAEGLFVPVRDVWTFMDYTWLVLAACGLLMAIFAGPLARRREDSMARLNVPGLATVAFIVLAALLFRFGAPYLEVNTWLWPYLQEARIPAYCLFAVAWARTLGLPARSSFIKVGGVLGFMVCADFTLRLLVPEAPGMEFATSQGTAALLLISLCAGFGEDMDDTSALRIMTMLGILATLSRPALFGAMWAMLCFGNGKWYRRIPYTLVCLLVLAATVISAHPIFDITPHYADYWMWLEGVKLLLEDPSAMFMGFPLADPLPGKVPFGLMYAWEQATGMSSMDGVYVFQATPMWLRLMLAWGVAAPAALMVALLVLVGSVRNRFMAGLATCVAAQGLLSGLIYDPVTAVPLWLAAFAAVAAGPDKKQNMNS